MKSTSFGFGYGRFVLLWYVAILFSIATISVNSLSASESYQLVAKWGSNGSGDGQFTYPRGIAVDASGNIYICDSYNNRVQKFNSIGTFITKWGSFSTTLDGKFNYPNGIAVDSSGNVYVADGSNHRIQKFDSSGTFITKWGSSGSGDSQFSFPNGVAVDSSGNVYVADSTNNRVQKFDSNGTFITKWGSSGSGDGQFYYARGIAVDASGYVYVSDQNNHRIQKFNSSGTFITKWGSSGTGDGQFNRPLGVAVDASGNVFVADEYNNRIQKFDSSGTFITKWGSNGSGDSQFIYPWGTAVDASGNVYVDDTYNHRIQKFSLAVSGSAPTVTTGSATNVTSNTAILNGTVNANGLSTNVWFDYGIASGSYTNTSATAIVSGSSATSVGIDISGLSSGTMHYYRIAAQNSAGTSYGSENSFNTISPETTTTTTTTTSSTTTSSTTTTNSPTTTSSTTSTTASTTSTTAQTTTTSSSTSSTTITTTTTTSSTTTTTGITTTTTSSTTTTTLPPTTPVATGVIAGSVVDALTTAPISGATVSTNGYSGTTGPDGSYVIPDVPAGDYTLTAAANGYTSLSQSITVVGGSAVLANFALLSAQPTPSPTPGGGEVFGLVYDEDDFPLRGVTVTIESNSFSKSAETDEDGYYWFDEFGAGNYKLTYEKEGYETQTQDISLEQGEIKDLGVVTMEQSEKGMIYGYAVNIKGNPLEFVRLRLKGIKTKVIKTASSDEDGFFEFTDLEADTYIIFAKKKKYRNARRNVKLGDGESEEIEIVMKRTSKRIMGLIEDDQ